MFVEWWTQKKPTINGWWSKGVVVVVVVLKLGSDFFLHVVKTSQWVTEMKQIIVFKSRGDVEGEIVSISQPNEIHMHWCAHERFLIDSILNNGLIWLILRTI